MAGAYSVVHEHDMRNLLEERGFKEVFIEGTREIVYGKIIAKNTCLRVYTSIVPVDGESRGVGEDAIRVCLVYRKADGTIVGIGSDARVYRLATWKKNLEARLEKWFDMTGPLCPTCDSPTKKRNGKYGEFFGCINFPSCRGLVKIQEKE